MVCWRLAAAAALRAEDFEPTQTYPRELALEVGTVRFELHHFGPGHTDNDSVVFLPEENVLHVGGLVFHESHSYVLPAHGTNLAGGQTSLRRARPCR